MDGTVPTATLAPSVLHRYRQPHLIKRRIRVPKKKHRRYTRSRIFPKQESHILAIASRDSTPSISMSRSSSGKVSASSGFTANLNPSAQLFTPTRVDSSPASTPVGHGDLAYHQAKAVEAANMAAAQGSRPPGYGPDDHRSSPVDPAAAAAGYSNYNSAYVFR